MGVTARRPAWPCAAAGAWDSSTSPPGSAPSVTSNGRNSPGGPVALITHSGSVFSALLRTRRHLGFTLAVSSGQELVTTTASYLEYALSRDETRVVGLLLETMREPDLLRTALGRAADRDVTVVALTVGRSEKGRAMVAAHSGALAGDDGAWEALFDAYGVIRVGDLDEMADTLELFAAGRRAPGRTGGGGIATVHDSGAERALVVDVAASVGVPFAPISDPTRRRLAALLDPGLVPGNPLDVWGTGSDTEGLFAGASLEPWPTTRRWRRWPWPWIWWTNTTATSPIPTPSWPPPPPPTNRSSSCPTWAVPSMRRRRPAIRAGGVPVLEGTRSGLRALRPPPRPSPGPRRAIAAGAGHRPSPPAPLAGPPGRRTPGGADALALLCRLRHPGHRLPDR